MDPPPPSPLSRGERGGKRERERKRERAMTCVIKIVFAYLVDAVMAVGDPTRSS